MRRAATIWLLANASGIVSYLLLASALWVRPSEQGTPGSPDDAFYWFVVLVPILVIFALVN